MSRQVSKVMKPFHVVFSIYSTSRKLREHDLRCGLCLLDWHGPAIFHLLCPKNTQRHSLRAPQVHQPVQPYFSQSLDTWKGALWTENTNLIMIHLIWFSVRACLCMRHFARSAFSSHPRRGSKFYLYESWTHPCLRPLSESEPGDELEVRTSKIVMHYLSTLWQKLVIDDPVWALCIPSNYLARTSWHACPATVSQPMVWAKTAEKQIRRIESSPIKTGGYRWYNISGTAHRHFLTQDLVRAGLHHADSLRTGRAAGWLRCRRSLDESRKDRPRRKTRLVKTSGLDNSACQSQRLRKQREWGLMRGGGWNGNRQNCGKKEVQN